MPPALSLSQVTMTPRHLERKAVIAMRQSSPQPGCEHLDSQRTPRTLLRRAEPLGWHPECIEVLDGALGQSAAGMHERDDFTALAAEVALGPGGVVFGWQVARVARNKPSGIRCELSRPCWARSLAIRTASTILVSITTASCSG